MAINFPSAPSNNQVFMDSTSGQQYIYDAASSKWKSYYIQGVQQSQMLNYGSIADPLTTSIQRRRGTYIEHSIFTGAEGEITVDTTRKSIVVHDGSTVGGSPIPNWVSANSTFYAYANAVGTAGNNYTNAVGTAGNNYTNSVGLAGNNYATVMDTAGNNYALTVATDIGTAGNNYTNYVGASANAVSATKVATVSGTAGRITSSGTTGITLDLATAGPGAGSYTSGISALTLDAYGRVTAVTGTANYVVSGGALGTPSSGTLTNCSFPTLNQNTTGSAATFTSTTQNSQFNSLGVNTAASGTAGEIRATNNITAYYSDIRLKTDITLITNAVEKIKQISGVNYRSNDIAAIYGYTDQSMQVGVLAQEIKQVLPEAVKLAPFDTEYVDGVETSKSGKNYMTVQYDRIIPLLIEAIKEQEKRIEQLENSLKKG